MKRKSFLPGKGCFIIAEISANHGGELGRALELIRAAKRCGADAVKFQTYTPDTLTIDSSRRYFRIRHPQWGGQTLYQLYQKACTPWEWFGKFKDAADKQGIVFFSTAFDNRSVDLLEEIGVPFHKVASFELVDLPLIRYMASTGKPIILSTGMAALEDIEDAVRAVHGPCALLKCVSSYPASPREMNLRTIPDLARRFRVPVGLSDHTLGIEAAVAAVALGARIIEKHFTLSRKVKTPDSFFSLEPQEFAAMVTAVRTAELSLGEIHYGLTPEQKRSRIFRRSLFVVKDMRRGEFFSAENLRSIRPSNGMMPKYYDTVIGRKAARNIRSGTPLVRELIAPSS